MECWNCDEKLTWGGSEEKPKEGFSIMWSHGNDVHCPKCYALVFVYPPLDSRAT